MKKGQQLVGIMIAGLVIMALSFSPLNLLAHAQEDSSETTETSQSEDTKPRKTLAERLAERKARRQTRLTFAQQTRLKARCKAAQGLLTSFHARVKGIQKNRVNLYDAVVDKLNALVIKIGDGADTTELKSEIEMLKEKITDFETDLEAYETAISDLVEMDCAADPTSFRASLDEAKSLHGELLKTSKSIRSYISETIKPSLQAIRAELAKHEDEVIN